MARPNSRYPTELELDILRILWREGPLPTRRVRDELAVADRSRDLAHTSVVTILNIMVRKQYLERTRRGNAYIFHPCITEQATTGGMLRDLVDRAFDGSATAVVLNILETADLDEQELEILRKLIERKLKPA